MRSMFFLIFVGLILTVNLSATIYEDGEDKESSRWYVLKPSADVIVENIYDKVKASQVIKLKGEGTKSAYILVTNEGASWENKEEKVLHWQMKYSEDFVVIVSLETKRGKRYLVYTPSSQNGYMQYGLGDEATNGIWQRYSRNLEEDLKYFDNQNAILMVNSFVIRGSGYVDNIKMMKEHGANSNKRIENRIVLKEPLVKEKIITSKIEKKPLHKVKTNTTPMIIMEGENPIFLTVGEAFEEPGIKAEDKEDGELIVISSENIDKNKEGEYSVIYMATDSEGNSAVDKRYVTVGEPPEGGDEDNERSSEKEHSSVDEAVEDTTVSTQESDEVQYRLEERELEIAEWEKELQLREKEISQREEHVQKSVEVHNQIQ